jgi:hypothetical protein
MIGNAADLVRMTAKTTDDAAEVFPEPVTLFLADPQFAVLSGEEDVIMQAGEGVWHGRRMGWHL